MHSGLQVMTDIQVIDSGLFSALVERVAIYGPQLPGDGLTKWRGTLQEKNLLGHDSREKGWKRAQEL